MCSRALESPAGLVLVAVSLALVQLVVTAVDLVLHPARPDLVVGGGGTICIKLQIRDNLSPTNGFPCHPAGLVTRIYKVRIVSSIFPRLRKFKTGQNMHRLFKLHHGN